MRAYQVRVFLLYFTSLNLSIKKNWASSGRTCFSSVQSSKYWNLYPSPRLLEVCILLLCTCTTSLCIHRVHTSCLPACRLSFVIGHFRGGLNRDVRICLRLIIVNPMYDTREIGFETVNEIKSFGTQNAVRDRRGGRKAKFYRA